MRALFGITAALFLASCGPRHSPEADAIDAFISGGIDSVTVYSLIPPDYHDQKQKSDKVAAEATFHDCPILKNVTVADHQKTKEIVNSVTKAMRERADPAKCFDPGHGIRIKKGDAHFDVVICYTCSQVEIWSTTHSGENDSTSSSSQAMLDAILQSSGSK